MMAASKGTILSKCWGAFAQNVEAARFSKTLLSCQITARCHIPKDQNLKICTVQNEKELLVFRFHICIYLKGLEPCSYRNSSVSG
jgi:hypothetical protein